MLFWNDLETGQSFTTDTLSLTAEDIIDFASPRLAPRVLSRYDGLNRYLLTIP